ncbi:MAG TPA: beta-galactosidase trimerization domain-containing protein [Tepidisphaeraceae bacterium]
MAKQVELRWRQIHLDFHTGPWIRDVGVEFDAREFARTMKAAHVDSVTVFAKCHHGHLYYDTLRPERHPGLRKGLPLLEQQVEALHREGIRAPIYISVMCDEWAANQHKDWIAIQPDGKHVGRGPLENRGGAWQILDMSSPYQEFLAEQTREILEKFKPVDGIFFDMTWDQPSVSKWAIQSMEKEGLNPETEADRVKHSHLVALRYMKRFKEMVLKSSRGASVFFNGRPVSNLREEMAFQTQTEIESLPTGGWGYMFFPKNVRFAKNFPLPFMGMTARFHKSWADFGGIKPYAALEYETSQAMAHGARCSIGDQMHPRGTLDRAAYELIGKIYQRVEEREPWLHDARTVAQIGVLVGEEHPTGQGGRIKVTPTDEGVVRILTQLKHQFDLVDREEDFARYELMILPDGVNVDEGLAKKISAYLKRGGKVLATGTSGLSADGGQVKLKELPVKAEGMSPYTTTYIRFGKEINEGVGATDHVMYERGVRVTAARGGKVLAKVVEPYFERTWAHFSSHFQTPPEKVSRYAAVVEGERVTYIAYPIFTAFALHGNVPFRLLVKNVLERMLPEPVLRVNGPVGMEATVAKQAKRTIVHLLQYTAERRTEKLDLIEDVVPVFQVPVSVRMEKAPKRVYIAPQGTDVAFEHRAGRVEVVVPELNGHAMVVME